MNIERDTIQAKKVRFTWKKSVEKYYTELCQIAN